MPSLYYMCAWTDDHLFDYCGHMHNTIISAVACTGSACAGAYVIAVEDNEFRELNSKEEAQFQSLMYGNPKRLKLLIGCTGRMLLC